MEKIKSFIKKTLQFLLNPRFVLCFGLAWLITNGWSYIALAIGTWLDIPWLLAIGGGYVAFLWLPISPEKIVTLTIAIALLRLLFPKDQKTLAVLQKMARSVRDGVRKVSKRSKRTMKIKAVLFDLDGTLVPMDQEEFTRAYFTGISAHLAQYGYEPKKLVDTVWAGTRIMIKNDGSKTNEQAFWEYFSSVYGAKSAKDMPYFEEFYKNKFGEIKKVCGFEERSARIVNSLKEKGFRVVLATNPLFPSIATEQRIRWAGLEPHDFELYTTYENSSYCKPNPEYYKEILSKLGLRAEECLMIGNDVGDDMIAATLGMQTFLLTDCLINRNGEDISKYPNGGFCELFGFIDTLK